MIAKRALLQIHRWCGLIAAAFILLQATTGAVLVFRDEIAQAIDPAGMTRHRRRGQRPYRKC